MFFHSRSLVVVHFFSCIARWPTVLGQPKEKTELFSFLLGKGCKSNLALEFPLSAHGWRPVTPHWICWFSNVQAHQLVKSSIQAFSMQNYLFASTSTNPTLDPLPLVIVSTLLYMYWLDKKRPLYVMIYYM